MLLFLWLFSFLSLAFGSTRTKETHLLCSCKYTNEHMPETDKSISPTLPQINIALAFWAKISLLFRKIQYFFVLWSKKPFTLISWGLLERVARCCPGATIRKDRGRFTQRVLHIVHQWVMETLNYESALDKFSSVSSFKETPPRPSQRNWVIAEGEDQQS